MGLELLSTGDAAKIVGCHRTLLSYYARLGRIPFVPISSGDRAYRRKDVMRFKAWWATNREGKHPRIIAREEAASSK